MQDRLHEDELTIDAGLARQLIESQFPDYAGQPISPLPASGSTNRLFRLGDEWLLRLPRQPGTGASVEKERRWNPVMALQLHISVPEILEVGQPEFGYPEKWAIVRWLEGDLPQACHPGGSASPERTTLAVQLAEVILALRAIPVPDEALADPSLRSYRGRPLWEFDQMFQRNIDSCRTLPGFNLDLGAAACLWSEALELPSPDTMEAERWFHGDLVAENLLLNEGRLIAALDFGGLSIGDPTIDLHGAWELFDSPAREAFRRTLCVDEAEWLRGRAWALAIALGCFSYYWNTMPGRCSDRMAMARSALADFG